MPYSQFQRGDPIPAAWLNEVAKLVLDQVTIVGPGRAKRIGNSLMIEIDVQGGGTKGAVSPLIPVLMIQTGGTGGDASNPLPSWTYTVKNALTQEVLGTSVSPTASPHHYRRAEFIGVAASYGLARLNPDIPEGFELIWCNEYELARAC